MAGRKSNGAGSIFKRKDGRWVGAYIDPIATKRHYVYGKTQKEVKEKMKEFKESFLNEKQERPLPAEEILAKEPETKEEKQLIEKVEIPKEIENISGRKTTETEREEVKKEQEGQSLAEWIQYYLYTYKKADLKASTFTAYLWKFTTYIEPAEISKKQVSQLTTNDLQRFYNSKTDEGYNSKTVRHMKILINGALEQAVRIGMIKENPNRYTILPKKKKFEANTLKKEDVTKIITEGKEEWVYPLVTVCMTCGLRKGELLGLRWENIDWEKRQIHITGSLCRVAREPGKNGRNVSVYEILEPKTKSSIRTIPMMQATYEALCIQKERQEKERELYEEIYLDNDLVFARIDGRYLDSRAVSEQFLRLLKKYDIPKVRFHDLRHTYATLLMESGVQAKVVQELMGHSSISTTLDIYTHVSEDLKTESIRGVETVFQGQEN